MIIIDDCSNTSELMVSSVGNRLDYHNRSSVGRANRLHNQFVGCHFESFFTRTLGRGSDISRHSLGDRGGTISEITMRYLSHDTIRYVSRYFIDA